MNLFELDVTDKNSSYYFIKNSEKADHISLRATMQMWFDLFPEAHQEGLRRRFASNDRSHYAAFFEFYCYQWLLSMGYTVKCLDDDGGEDKTPDFLVTNSEDGNAFYFECTVISNSDELTSKEKKEETIIEWVNKSGLEGVEVALSFGDDKGQSPNKKDFLAFLRKKVTELRKNQYESVALGESYNVEWLYESPEALTVTITPYRAESANSPCHTRMWNDTHGWGAGQKKIIRNLGKKAAKQRICNQNLPYVIAANLSGQYGFGAIEKDEFVVWTSLCGSRIISIPRNENGISGEGKGDYSYKNSFWFRPDGKLQNTSVSAVLFNTVMPWNHEERKPILWHTPLAKAPLSEEVLKLSQWVYDTEEGALKFKE